MRFSTTPAMVVKAAHSSTGKRYSLCQFKTLFGVSPYVTAVTWDYMLTRPDTVQKDLLLQDLLKALHFLKCYSAETNWCGII